jgi:hypothetical protein
MSQPPYGAPPPQPGQPQGYPPQPGAAAPPAYLQGGPPAAAPAGYPAGGPVGGPVGGGYGLALPPPPPSKKRTIGFLMGLLTALALLGFAGLVLAISLLN